MNSKFIYFFLLFGFGFTSFPQNKIDQIQYGATLKAKITINPYSKNEPNINFRISSNIGIAGNWLTKNLYPSVNAEFQIYNGGLGSKNFGENKKITVDGILAFTLTSGSLKGNFESNSILENTNNPLRYFADFAIPSLQNPFRSSVSVGSNLVFTTDRERNFQQVGFLNVNHSSFQISYYNDGTPFQYFLFGDGKDRYYTGGGIISYNAGFGEFDQLKSYSFELSYHKFTGFNQNSFEMSNSINASNVDYKNEEQKYYNKSLWKFNLQSNDINNGLGIAFSAYNSIRYDGQHLIHWLKDNSFHIVPYNTYYALEPSFYSISNSFKN